jgi:hypothetical protein
MMKSVIRRPIAEIVHNGCDALAARHFRMHLPDYSSWWNTRIIFPNSV